MKYSLSFCYRYKIKQHGEYFILFLFLIEALLFQLTKIILYIFFFHFILSTFILFTWNK